MRHVPCALGLACALPAMFAFGQSFQSPGPNSPARSAAKAEAPEAAAEGFGQLLIRDAQEGSMRRLAVARYHANVVLHPPVALVQIDQSFYNPYSGQEEGTFVFNLPRGASVSRFAMFVTPERLVEGEVIERSRASNVYETIVHGRRDPAILEQIADNLFRMRVFPIPGKGMKRILLDFTLPLDPEPEGTCQFTLPLFSDREPIWDFRLSGTIVGPTPLESVRSASHPELDIAQVDQRKRGREALPATEPEIRFEFNQRNYAPRKSFSLRFDQRPEGAVALRTYRAGPLARLKPMSRPQHRGQEQAELEPASLVPMTYFRAELRDTETAAKPPAPADVLLLVDTSSGMRGRGSVRRMARELVASLRPDDRVRLVAVDVAARPIGADWAAGRSEAAAELPDKLDEEFCLGGTNLEKCLDESLKLFDAKKTQRRRIVIYIGDGQDTLGSASGKELVEHLADAVDEADASLTAVYVPGRGPQHVTSLVDTWLPGRELLDRVARACGGLLLDGWDDSDRRTWHRWLEAGLPEPVRIVELKVDGARPEDLFYPTARLPDEPFTVLGRTWVSEKVVLTLTTRVDGKPVQQRHELAVDPVRDDVFIGRLWAQHKLQRMIRDLPPYAGNDDSANQNIVWLSREWSLLSPLTAFLVLESDEEYPRWGIARWQRRRYWKPATGLVPLEPDEQWFARITPKSAAPDPSAESQLARAVDAARKALADDDPSEANRALEAVEQFDSGDAPAHDKAFEELRRRTTEELRRRAILAGLRLRRSLFDPAASTIAPSRPSLGSLLGAPLPAGEHYRRLFPHYDKLLKRTDLSVPQLRLGELADMLSRNLGVSVTIDKRALEDVGISEGMPLEPVGWGRTSWRAYLRHALGQFELTFIDKKDQLVITTPEEAENRLAVEVYPVADLLLSDRAAPPELLVDPYLDRQLATEERIRRKLRQPITVEYKKTPLVDVIWHIAQRIDDAVVLDRRALEAVGIGADEWVTGTWREMPVEEVLRTMLRRAELEFTVRDEALVVTTPEEVEDQLATRVYSGQGLVYEYRVPALQGLTPSRWLPGFRNGFAGGFGGMGGGMATGGGMFGGGMFGGGGFGGGGFGGGGFGGGGFGGGGFGGGGAAVPAGRSDPGISTGGGVGAESRPPSADAEPSEEPQPEEPPMEEPVPAEPQEPAPEAPGIERIVEPVYQADYDSLIQTITMTIEPPAWIDVGGHCSIAPFPSAVAVVVSATLDVHQKVEQLLQRLLEIPPVVAETPEMRPARPPQPTSRTQLDFDSLIQVITSTVEPPSWGDVGGPGSIMPDRPRGALVLSHTQNVHADLWQLLTQLRRARYASTHPDRPWQHTPPRADVPMIDPWQLGANAAELLDAKLPEPQPQEMAALQVRKVPERGRWVWRKCDADGREVERVTIIRDGVRLEVQLPEATVRLVDGEVAVAWNELGLVELGRWAEALRQSLDARLPWLPHRSNRQLARSFAVRSDEANDADSLRLRLVPPGCDPDGDSLLLADFSADAGRLTRLESHLTGALARRWIVSDGGAEIVEQDAAGKTIARWQRLEHQDDPATVDSLEAWPGPMIRLDRRGHERVVDRRLAYALDAMQHRDWQSASRALAGLAAQHPGNPTLAVLQADCYENDATLGPREQRLAGLRRTMAAGTRALFDWIIEGHLQWLTAEERYSLLTSYPADLLSAAADHDALAQAATQAGNHAEGLAHLEAAIRISQPQGWARFHFEQRRVDLLVKLGRADDAVKAAAQWAARPDAQPDELIALAGLVAKAGRREAADALFQQALAEKRLPADDRADALRARAGLHEGLARWRLIVEAAAILPDTSPRRRTWIEMLKAELSHPAHADAAAALAKGIDDNRLQVVLLIRQAELTSDPKIAGDVAWDLYRCGRLPADRLLWAADRWLMAGTPSRTVALCESRLRAGKTLDPTESQLRGSSLAWSMRPVLEDAYRELGRTVEAQRAATEDPEHEPAPVGPWRPRGQGFF